MKMKTSSHRFTTTGTIAAFTIVAALCGCHKSVDNVDTGAPAASATIGTQVDDSIITTKVRSALVSDDAIKSLDIKVETFKGEVMLSGFADNQAQIDRSIEVARSIEGVKNVTNKLSLKQGIQSVGNKIDDSVITAKVKSSLLADPIMKSLDVSVTTRKGEVQLSGFVDNDTQSMHAVDITTRVEGVTNVVNHMTIKK